MHGVRQDGGQPHHGQRGGGQGAVPGQRVSGHYRLRRRVLHRLRQGGGGPGGEAPAELGENERDLEGPQAPAPPDRRPHHRRHRQRDHPGRRHHRQWHPAQVPHQRLPPDPPLRGAGPGGHPAAAPAHHRHHGPGRPDPRGGGVYRRSTTRGHPAGTRKRR